MRGVCVCVAACDVGCSLSGWIACMLAAFYCAPCFGVVGVRHLAASKLEQKCEHTCSFPWHCKFTTHFTESFLTFRQIAIIWMQYEMSCEFAVPKERACGFSLVSNVLMPGQSRSRPALSYPMCSTRREISGCCCCCLSSQYYSCSFKMY